MEINFVENVSTFTFKSLTWFSKLVQSARYFCELSMITHAVLALRDTFAPQLASIQSILDSVEFFFKLQGNFG